MSLWVAAASAVLLALAGVLIGMERRRERRYIDSRVKRVKGKHL